MTDLVAEREHHDAFYGGPESARLSTPIFEAALDAVWRVLARVLRRHDRPAILSLGSGNGSYELRAGALASRIVGIELSPVAVAGANEKARAAGLSHVSFVAGDLAQAPALTGGEKFDVVWSIAVLHHLSPSERADCLRMAHSLLRPGGTFVSYDPNRYRLVALAKPLVRRLWNETHSPEERELAPKSVRRDFETAGFTDVSLHPVDFALGPLAWTFPGTPRWLVPVIARIDALVAALPLVGRVASGFAAVGERAPDRAR